MAQQSNNNKRRYSKGFSTLFQAGLFLIAITSSQTFQVVNSETKEFDWSDLGVSLTNSKAPYNGGSNNNLRILVSPQRRMTKNYELDYSNNSQPTSVSGETSYVLPAGSSSYITPGHSSAYSALSASLASLKNRLNARGVTLNGQLSEGSSHPNLYSGTSVSSFGSSLSESQRSAPAQPAYLSVANQQDPQSQGGFSSSQNQSNENKTIVLAIPAKINFLTDAQTSKQQQSQQHQQQTSQVQQPQQLTLIQATPVDQQTRPEYVKQLGLISGQDGSTENAVRDPTADQEQQYVILNSGHTLSNEHPHLVTSSLANSQSSNPIYSSTIYQQGTNSMKYAPAYQTSNVQSVGQNYETQPVEHHYGGGICLDTCNSSDSRWRKYTVSKYRSCCSRSSQYDSQFEQPSADKLSEASRLSDDAYYSYLYRRTRARRSRRPQRERHSSRYSRYSSPVVNSDQEGPSVEGASSESFGPAKYNSARLHHYYDSPYVKYYKIRQQSHDSADSHESNQYGAASGRKYLNKERGYRRGHARDSDVPESQPNPELSSDDDDSPPLRGSSGYGNGDHSVESGRYPSSFNEDEEGRIMSHDELPEPEITKNGSALDSSDYLDPEGPIEEGELEAVPKYSNTKRRKSTRKGRGRKNGKEVKYYGKAKGGRKFKQNKLEYGHSNGTDYDPVQSDEHSRPDVNNQNEEDQLSGQREPAGLDGGDVDKENIFSNNKYKSASNDSTVANLSKTTMHLKEILSMLEKKALQKVNETSTSQPNQIQTATPTPAPQTTTNYYSSLFSSQYSNPSIASALSSDYMNSELSMKSPFRDASSLSASLSLPSSYSSLAADHFSPLSSFSSSQYGLGLPKHMPIPIGHHHRKRRMPKNVQYSQLMLPKSHGLSSSTSLLNSMQGKNPFMSPGYYRSIQYPYWYPRHSHHASINSYPFKSKSNYQSLMSGSVPSRLASAASGSLYTDELRYNGLTYNDPLTNVASSLRPSTTMRLRTKPFVIQPHVLPIYSRHSILTQPIDVKK